MPISIARLRELIDLAASGSVETLDLMEDGTHIRISRTGTAPVSRLAPQDTPKATAVDTAPAQDRFTAPMFGVLHLTPAPGAPPFVTVGDRVRTGQQLCLIEAMKMFNAVHSDRDGRLAAILADPGSEIARGQPLFQIIES